MNLKKLKARLLALFFVLFAAGYAAESAWACSRLQANCSYNVTGYYCTEGCCVSRCCYFEYGDCLYTTQTGTSQICGGLCGAPEMD